MGYLQWMMNRGMTFKFIIVSLLALILATFVLLWVLLPRLERSVQGEVLLAAAALVFVTILVVYRVVSAMISHQTERIAAKIALIVEGKGDLTKRLAPEAEDEFGQLTCLFDRFAGEMHATGQGVESERREVSRQAAFLGNAAGEMQGAAQTQRATLDEISTSLCKLSTSLERVAGDADVLLLAVEAASSSTCEISASIKDVAHTTETLDATADTIHSAVNQIASSLKQVTANLVLLAELTGSASSSASNISSAIKDVTANVQDQAGIAKDVKEAAATAGLEALKSSKEGMEKIRKEVFTTNDAIENLSSKSDRIGHIVGAIGTVAEETNLLALNAAILAAQAGENGKAFAVIAEKVRGLARRSAESTKNISTIIGEVQQDINLAGKAVKRSIQEVDNGVHLSIEAESVLREIVAKAEASLDKALEVESSIALQSKSVELNASAIQNFKKMSADIKKAVAKQSQSADEIARGVNDLRSCTGYVKQSLSEQSKEGERIAEIVQALCSSTQIITGGAKEGHVVAGELADAIAGVKLQAEQILVHSCDLVVVTGELEGEEALFPARVGSIATH